MEILVLSMPITVVKCFGKVELPAQFLYIGFSCFFFSIFFLVSHFNGVDSVSWTVFNCPFPDAMFLLACVCSCGFRSLPVHSFPALLHFNLAITAF